MSACTALLIALLAGAAVDDDAAYRDAVKLYQSVRLEAAAARFRQALAHADSHVDEARIDAWLGLIHAQLGQTATARQEFAVAVAADIDVKLPALAPAEIEAMLEQARLARALPLPPATATRARPGPPATPTPTPTQTQPLPLASKLASQAGIAAGGAGVGGGVVLFFVGLDTVFRQAPAAPFNDEGHALLQRGYVEYAVAGALIVAGAGAIAGGIYIGQPPRP